MIEIVKLDPYSRILKLGHLWLTYSKSPLAKGWMLLIDWRIYDVNRRWRIQLAQYRVWLPLSKRQVPHGKHWAFIPRPKKER